RDGRKHIFDLLCSKLLNAFGVEAVFCGGWFACNAATWVCQVYWGNVFAGNPPPTFNQGDAPPPADPAG
ncbi:hypothetical protein, partial [Pseudomonas edaphica]|uniref:hypothetical protein n=1 Tax=Pseudomonas edaphica TaxID=2006980 RepID=UPI001F3761F1